MLKAVRWLGFFAIVLPQLDAAIPSLTIGVVNYDASYTVADRVAMRWALEQSKPLLTALGWNASLKIFKFTEDRGMYDSLHKLRQMKNLTVVVAAYFSAKTRAAYPFVVHDLKTLFKAWKRPCQAPHSRRIGRGQHPFCSAFFLHCK